MPDDKSIKASAKPISLPFDEAINFFRQKVNLPTERWNDLWKGMHARGFMIAGAMKSELLSDFRQAVDKAIAEGTTLETFRKDFDKIVARHGWSYNGGRGWRTRVILETNISMAYCAGRHKQMTDPDMLRLRPYWEYRHGDSRNPRPLHLSWHGLVLPADDPWWKTHSPRNGWGCKCMKFALSKRDLERLGKEGPDTAPDDGTYEWEDKKTGEVHTIPNGIDPGWDYSVGDAAWGRRLSDRSMKAWQAQGADAWTRLDGGSWQTFNRPAKIPVDTPRAKLGPALAGTQAIRQALETALGGEEKVYSFAAGGFRSDILVNAGTLAEHIPADRSPFLPFIEELLTDPYEVWMSFEQHKGTGQVVLRQRVIKAIRLEKDRGLMLVAQAKNGFVEAWTMVPTRELTYLNKQRAGRLMWARK